MNVKFIEQLLHDKLFVSAFSFWISLNLISLIAFFTYSGLTFLKEHKELPIVN